MLPLLLLLLPDAAGDWLEGNATATEYWLLRKLQAIHNAAARVITGAKKYERIID